jgi:hypothetical protein
MFSYTTQESLPFRLKLYFCCLTALVKGSLLYNYCFICLEYATSHSFHNVLYTSWHISYQQTLSLQPEIFETNCADFIRFFVQCVKIAKT